MSSVKIKKLDSYDNSLPLPTYETELAAGADIRANLPDGELIIEPGDRKSVV